MENLGKGVVISDLSSNKTQLLSESELSYDDNKEEDKTNEKQETSNGLRSNLKELSYETIEKGKWVKLTYTDLIFIAKLLKI